MNNYPDVVAKITNDYLERVKVRLRLVPAHEQQEFLKEIQSHIYEAYRQTIGEDEIARILSVLRNFGEPAEVVFDRLPDAMVRSGRRRNLPLYIMSGILIALFGIPLGFGGVGVLIGLLFALAGVVIAYYAAAGSIFLVGTVFALMGFIRMLAPELWDKLIRLGFIHIEGPVADFLRHFPPSDQGLLIILFASVFVIGGWGMLRSGKYLFRGFRFLFTLILDGTRRLAQSIRRKLRLEHSPVSDTAEVSPAGLGSSSMPTKQQII